MAKQITARGEGKAVPPPLQFVLIYFDQKGSTRAEANGFFQFHTANNWVTPTGRKLRDWKAAASKWIWDSKETERGRTKKLLQTSLKNGL